ncbi:hypothetical protein NUW58_g6947 [Xylaria curta]|uniref:Uncharacterized protein n=1 Tax=Xylaria curta TaxID=42375 RepID=A0ACC1NND8_9PEZI|nr:hypothetical protein NUW58_g6947 [Xylaria curta]
MMDAFLKRAPQSNRSTPPGTPSLKETPASVTEEPPNKRVKLEWMETSDADSDEYHIDTPPLKPQPILQRDGTPGGPLDDDLGDRSEAEDANAPRPTAIECSLPQIKLDKQAIEEYQSRKAARGNDVSTASSRLDSRAWVKGRSSLYVDAFNLALDTVLNEEIHLFDNKEKKIFEEWRSLNYEAQFLYVRLFLRKTSLWHRIARLGYSNDVTDTEAAVKELQKSRDLPRETSPNPTPLQSELSTFVEGQCTFKDTFTFADASEDFVDSVEEAVSLLGLDEIKASQLLEFEAAMRLEYTVDSILEFNGPVTEAGFRKVIDVFEAIYPRWKSLLQEEEEKEERVYESGEGAYLRRLSPGHAYTRIVHKVAYTFGRLKEHHREHTILTELLSQRLFHLARRGSWYQRKALLEEHYMHTLLPNPAYTDPDRQKSHWKSIAAATCERALEDPDCHLKYHYDLQKRLVKLEKQLKIPLRLQHDFGHVRLKKPEEHYAEGIQLKKLDAVGKNGRGPGTKTIWVDEVEGGGECSVESMCLSWYRSQGWKGYHAEGGIIRTLFAYLFFDILFLYIPNVFQTAYQTCPLDLHTDAFYATRASEINHRLVEIANGGAPKLIDEVDKREREKRTCVIGLNWEYELHDLLELADCFDGAALAAVCKVMAQEYGQRGGGIPDLILWRVEPQRECMFVEVKSANDRLSDTQRLWIHVLAGAGLRVALCNAVAKEVKEI